MRVGLFITCLVDVMRPEIAEATVRLLESAGCTVEVPMAQTCCGQPGYNAGDTASARDLARKVLAEFERFEHVVLPSGSCGGMIRHHFPVLFADDPDLRVRIEALAARTWDARPEQRVAWGSSLLLLWGIGSMVGPLVASFMMQALGSDALFVFVGVLGLALSIFVTWQIRHANAAARG